jgi:hypothetical protein
MPGVDLTQLVEGITYPNSTYLGNAFAPNDEFTLDTDLQDQPLAGSIFRLATSTLGVPVSKFRRGK